MGSSSADCKVFENESDVDIDVKAMSTLKRMLQEVSTECQHLQMSPRRLARSLTDLASLHEFKIADNDIVCNLKLMEEDGEDPGNQDLEQMFRFDLNKEINEHKAEDANGLQFGWMPWEGSSASTLCHIMDVYIIRDRSDDVSSEHRLTGPE